MMSVFPDVLCRFLSGNFLIFSFSGSNAKKESLSSYRNKIYQTITDILEGFCMIRLASPQDANIILKIMVTAFDEYKYYGAPSNALDETVASVISIHRLYCLQGRIRNGPQRCPGKSRNYEKENIRPLQIICRGPLVFGHYFFFYFVRRCIYCRQVQESGCFPSCSICLGIKPVARACNKNLKLAVSNPV